MANQPTHVAYSDESYTTASRFRSIAVITLEQIREQTIAASLRDLIEECGISEFKWTKLRQARDRFAALKMIEKAVKLSLRGWIRVDVLIWDTSDRRHDVPGRDDVANLQRMYYHLLRNVLLRRWPAESTWHLFPDENSALDWATVQDYLDEAGYRPTVENALFHTGGFRLRLSRDFRVLQISEMVSSEAPFCQLADLFAGIGAYSHASYDKYENWAKTESGQLTLDLELDDGETQLSNRDRERCRIMRHLDSHCKRYRLGVGLRHSKDFKTYDPGLPVNFWLYEPQHPDDRAPLRSKESWRDS